MPRFPVQPDADALVSVRHGLGTDDLTVTGYTAAGEPRSVGLVHFIDADSIDARVTPDTTMIEIVALDDISSADAGG